MPVVYMQKLQFSGAKNLLNMYKLANFISGGLTGLVSKPEDEILDAAKEDTEKAS